MYVPMSKRMFLGLNSSTAKKQKPSSVFFSSLLMASSFCPYWASFWRLLLVIKLPDFRHSSGCPLIFLHSESNQTTQKYFVVTLQWKICLSWLNWWWKKRSRDVLNIILCQVCAGIITLYNSVWVSRPQPRTSGLNRSDNDLKTQILT